MGAYLSTPKTEKDSVEESGACFRYGASAMQGWRTEMEDAHIATLDMDLDSHLFGVFDGHGGKEVSIYCSHHLNEALVKSPAFKEDPGQALIDSFLEMDRVIQTTKGEREAMTYGKSSGGGGDDGDGGDQDAFMKTIAAEIERATGLKLNLSKDGENDDDDDDDKAIVSEIHETSDTSSSLTVGDTTVTAEQHTQTDSVAVSDGESVVEKTVETSLSSVSTTIEDDDEEDEDVSGRPSKIPGGCTSVVAMIRGNKVYVANAGDSRAVISKAGVATPLSIDHKPHDEEEFRRITAAGGYVRGDRVNGNLNLSRAIGDLQYKTNPSLAPKDQIITAYPDIQELELTPEHDFLILACDGIWDVMTNQEAVDFVRERLAANPEVSLASICELMMDFCLAVEAKPTGVGCDNMTAMIVDLRRRDA
eukprot:TRINITY_DN330_c0_g1_i1.p2 TRINITY_DN330_c0_g1~~TRINITY_DN330_c0_g1_i1.p2  ORF type:complete len:420 (+),score=140.92 TRINITY_DN330_c0_g1_i1:66-1325(+)